MSSRGMVLQLSMDPEFHADSSLRPSPSAMTMQATGAHDNKFSLFWLTKLVLKCSRDGSPVSLAIDLTLPDTIGFSMAEEACC